MKHPIQEGCFIQLQMLRDNNRDYAGAEKDIVRAIKYYQDNDKQGQIVSQPIISWQYYKLEWKKFDKALEYHMKAKEFIPFSRKRDRFDNITTNTNNVASNYLNKGDYKQAISTYKPALANGQFIPEKGKFLC